MENNQKNDKTNYLRWFISIALIVILIIHLFVYRSLPSLFDFTIIAILFIFGVTDRFKIVKIPGLVELKDKTKSMDKKLDKVVNQIQQIQNQGVNLYFNP